MSILGMLGIFDNIQGYKGYMRIWGKVTDKREYKGIQGICKYIRYVRDMSEYAGIQGMYEIFEDLICQHGSE